MLPKDGSGEIFVLDVGHSSQLRKMIAADFPQVRTLSATDLTYDEAKSQVIKEAHGKYILFLDGDCLPQPNWHNHFLSALRKNPSQAYAGFTVYEGEWLAKMMTVMDFGFLLPRKRRVLPCYASNDCAFSKETLEKFPLPKVCIRNGCFYHAQVLARANIPFQLVPEASVLHQLPPIIRERSRQGFDTIGACWVDPKLPEAKWLKLGIFSIPLFYALNIFNDWRRTWAGHKDLELRFWQTLLSFPLFLFFRLIDVCGMFVAFTRGRREEAWGGFSIN